ncbi:CNH domain-containing protein [Globomyces pollinis-pini]|nr:CNH domain-containing protein [Globomyces pollinis-pini]
MKRIMRASQVDLPDDDEEDCIPNFEAEEMEPDRGIQSPISALSQDVLNMSTNSTDGLTVATKPSTDHSNTHASAELQMPSATENILNKLTEERKNSNGYASPAEPPNDDVTRTEHRPVFKAERVCRLAIQINCADFLNDTLLFGTDDRLYAFETKQADARLVSLSNRRYCQIDSIPQLDIIISRSGKYDVVSVHDTSSLLKLTRTKFETETKLRKLKETKGCSFYCTTQLPNSVYISICMDKSVMIMKYAPHPYNRFMKVKDFPVDSQPTMMEIIETSMGDIKLLVDFQYGFKLFDFHTSTVEVVSPPNTTPEMLGIPVKGIRIGDLYAMCYRKMGYIQPSHKPLLNWRYPLTFAAKIGDEYLLAGSNSIVDVIHTNTGKIVHVFETKKEKIRSLCHLVSRSNQVYLLAEEEKDGIKTVAIILIELC